MNKKEFSPYIRVAMSSVLTAPFIISDRVIFDYEIILADGGACRITIDGHEYLCKKNDVIFLRPGINHKFECADGCDFVQPHIHFDVTYNSKSEKTPISFKPKSTMNKYELSLIQDDVFKDVPIPDVFIPADLVAFKKIFFEIIGLFQNKAYNYEILYKAKMLELLNCILTQFDRMPSAIGTVTDNPVIAVKNYIDNNYLSVITLNSLAKQFYFNKYTLMRKFKSLYGQNIIAYYHNKRIEYIKENLRTTSLPVTVLSEKLNFSDLYSFSRFFKNRTGCSPLEFRKKNTPSGITPIK